MAKNASTFASQNTLTAGKNQLMRNLRKTYTPSPAEAEFDGLTAWFETIQLCP